MNSIFLPRSADELAATVGADVRHAGGARFAEGALESADEGDGLRRECGRTFLALGFHRERHADILMARLIAEDAEERNSTQRSTEEHGGSTEEEKTCGYWGRSAYGQHRGIQHWWVLRSGVRPRSG